MVPMNAAKPILSRQPDHASGLDRWAIGLSGLCVMHCVTSSILIALMSTAGGLLAAPIIHEVGLIVAILLGVVALRRGVLRHRRAVPVVIGATGLGTMGWAMTLPHDASGGEAMWTIIGVVLLAIGHLLNQRAARLAPAPVRP